MGPSFRAGAWVCLGAALSMRARIRSFSSWERPRYSIMAMSMFSGEPAKRRSIIRSDAGSERRCPGAGGGVEEEATFLAVGEPAFFLEADDEGLDRVAGDVPLLREGRSRRG